jgi:protein gp37
MGKTTIEWASHTLNFYDWSCHKVSPGCKHCYAEALATRYGQTFTKAPTFRPNVFKELRALPLNAVAFVNSMSDTYHEQASLQMIHSVHNAALLRPDVTFLLLTKRPERAYALSHYLAYPPNLWVGTSVEHSDYMWRPEFLLAIPAAGHFLSAEPLLSSLVDADHPARSITNYLYHNFENNALLRKRRTFKLPYVDGEYSCARLRTNRLRWVIVGGESGGSRRAFDADWARQIRDRCTDAGVPLMFKQGSAFKPGQDRLLDGRTWDETPFTS